MSYDYINIVISNMILVNYLSYKKGFINRTVIEKLLIFWCTTIIFDGNFSCHLSFQYKRRIKESNSIIFLICMCICIYMCLCVWTTDVRLIWILKLIKEVVDLVLVLHLFDTHLTKASGDLKHIIYGKK